ncbi:hypothetical protein AN958_06330 [Leucoagaricus sp. SymC.cos]|nr:hypothetical protein AN958_06330 [Leucoagaricus sp. SymC.cos]
MSDEYASFGYRGTLANKTIGDQIPTQRKGRDFKFKQTEDEVQNYPDEGDTTSSGGFGSSTNIYSPRAQRGYLDPTRAGKFRTPDMSRTQTPVEGGIGDVKKISGMEQTNHDDKARIWPLGPIYSDGMAGSEEEIEDAIAGGYSRYELGIQFDRHARNAANDVVEI